MQRAITFCDRCGAEINQVGAWFKAVLLTGSITQDHWDYCSRKCLSEAFDDRTQPMNCVVNTGCGLEVDSENDSQLGGSRPSENGVVALCPAQG